MAGAVLLVGFLVVAAVVLCRDPGTGRPAKVEPPAAESATTDGSRVEHGGIRLVAGETFIDLAGRFGMDRPTTDRVTVALDAAGFDFRTMRVGDSVTVERVDSRLLGFTYHLDLACGYAVELAPGGATARLVTRPVDTTLCVIRGAVSGSLWQSLTDAGAGPQLVEYYCEVLRSQVSFPRDVEKDDSFGLIAERLEVDGEFYRFGDIRFARYAGRRATGDACLFRPDSGACFYADADGRSLHRLLEFAPVENARRTSDFGPRMHPFRRRRINHAGLDYAAPFGAPVRTVAAGTVTRRGWYGGYGRTVDVEHAAGGLSSRYAHLSRYGPGVKVGSRVERGQVVGYVGSTGVSTGFHLDLSVRRAGKPVDPLAVLPSGFRQIPAEAMPGFLAEAERLRNLLESARDGQ